jgi:formate hydrogenlyase subunit 3/multisubunit Na+/H+ antiporter MnhD subunit
VSPADWLLPLLVVLPLALAIAAFLGQLPARHQVAIALGGLGLVGLGALAVPGTAAEATLWLGGWAPPLGIAWRLDTPAALLLAMVGLLMGLASLALLAEPDSRDDRYLWSLWWLLWAALNAVLLSRDLFNLYVTLELMSLAAVGLVSRSREDPYHVAALRYLMASLLASLLYLLGVALLYGQTGRLDLVQLAAVLEDGPAARLAALAVTLGLLIKAAMVPLHSWLPAAHSRARAPVSALLSGAVVAAALMVLWRLWLGPFAELGTLMRQALAALGALAMIWGGIQALLQSRLKLVIAWSTLSQGGYALLLPAIAGPAAWQGIGARGALLLLVAHGLAKGGLFLAAGRLHHHLGHDRLAGLAGSARTHPLAWAAIGLGGLSLMGLPPSGGFMGKWWLLRAALEAGQPLLVAVMLLGTLLTAAWLWRIASTALAPAGAPTPSPPPETRRQAAPALLLVLLAWLAGLAALVSTPGLELALPRLGGDRLAWLLPALLIWPLALLAARSGTQAGTISGSPRGLTALLGIAALAHLLTLVAGDLFTFYLGAAWLGLAGWGLVRLGGGPGAGRAAAGYLAMMMIAEVSLLLGLSLAWQASPSLAFDDLARAGLPWPALTALGLGLAIKAGAIGVHAWLPLAHPVAPPVASAVLSGLMIKVGVLGGVLLMPGAVPESRVGLALVAAGLAGALYGALRGLTQAAPKPLLAWSSVSQMGLATALLGLHQLGSPAALPALLGLVAAHALAKAALFLGAGLVARSAGRRGLLLGALALPAITLAGMPPGAGMAVKTGLEQALNEATLPAWPVTLSGVLTGLLMLRLFWLLARSGTPAQGEVAPGWLLAALGGLGALAALLPWALVDAPVGDLSAPGAWLKALLPALAALALGAGLMLATPLHRQLAVRRWHREVRARARRMGARRETRRWRWRLRRADAWLMPWPAFGVCLGLTALLLGLAGLA